MVYISHLDVMTLFRRAVRRARLPFVLSNGFSPRVKISIPKALKLGIESKREEMFITLKDELSTENIKNLINDELPSGINIISIERNG